MEEMAIRSRRALHPGQSSPTHRPPNRREHRHLSPHLSGSEDDENDELFRREICSDTTVSGNSTSNSWVDFPDGLECNYNKTARHIQFYPDGKIKEVNETITKKRITTEKKKESYYHYAILVGVLLMFVLGIAILNSPYRVLLFASEGRQQIQCSFELSERKFPNQDKHLWKSLRSGVEDVLNKIPTSPSIFLLAYEDINTVNRVAQSIVQRTTECMDSKVNAVELSPTDLAYKEMKADYGVVLKKYQNQLRKSGVMLINDLNKVPSEVAKAFHTLCDIQNPLVDRSIIFLTMQFTHSNSNGNPMQLVENYLRSNWSELENFVLDPLIARVTDQVFVLKKE